MKPPAFVRTRRTACRRERRCCSRRLWLSRRWRPASCCAGLLALVTLRRSLLRFQIGTTSLTGGASGSSRGPGYNSDAMRDREHALDKPPGVLRIVCLGDSVTAGHILPLQHTYPALFESFLQQMKVPVEVFNVAVSGWSTLQEVMA